MWNDPVHIHEVGTLNSIVAVTDAVIGMETLGIEYLYILPLPSGSSTTNSAHGTLPLPTHCQKVSEIRF
jgi:uncharacterized protein (DUF111 family)